MEVELWRIDDSRPAVNFKLVATPNEWRKQTVSDARTAASTVSEKRIARYRGFYQELIDTLREDHSFTKARQALAQNWYRFSVGYGQGAQFGANFDSQKEEPGSNCTSISGNDKDWNRELFDQLEERKDDIESELGEPLEWDRLGNPRIAVVRRGSIDDDEETLAEIRAWMVERLLKFRRVFGPRLDELVV